MPTELSTTDARELLAVGLFGARSSLRGRIETLLHGGRTFSTRASAANLATSAAALGALTIAASLAPHWIAFAQQAPHEAFEVTSVKPSTTADFRAVTYEVSPNGKVTLKNLPLLVTIAAAYHLPLQARGRITGAPDWITNDRFDIEATPPEGAFPASLSEAAHDARLRAMLQALLADRFKLAIHSDTKVVPVYAVVAAKNGPKLQQAKVQEEDCPKTQVLVAPPGGDVFCHTFTGGQGRGAHSPAANVADLALFVSAWADRPIVDKTGLKGLYKIDTQPWIPMRLGPSPPDGAKGETGAEIADLPTVFGIFESLGLKLESQQAPVEYFIVDHVEKPSAN